MNPAGAPPRLLASLLARILPRDWREAGTGDFEELYADILARRGRRAAVAWYLLQIVRTLPHFVLDVIRWRTIMMKNYLLITVRDIGKNKVSSVINILGLAVGIACALLLMLFVRYETSFDRFHKDGDRIFRVVNTSTAREKPFSSPITKDGLGPRLAADIPEVADCLRLYAWLGFVVESGGKRLTTDPLFADANLFRFFSFPLVQGDRASVLADPGSVVISQGFAKRMFGRDNPLGKTIALYTLEGRSDFKVTGLMRDVPPNSHLQAEFVAPLSFLRNDPKERNLLVSTYLRLHNAGDRPLAESKFSGVVKQVYSEAAAGKLSFRLQRLADIHMRSNLDYEFGVNRNKIDPKIFGPLALIALLVLLIAAINSVNLATARASRRALEVGLRKVIGASRPQLVRQFLAEAVIMAFLSLLAGLLLAGLFLPAFNSLMARKISLDVAANLPLIAGLLALTLAVGVLSGLYPAAFLASFQPAESLSGRTRSGGRRGGRLRKSLSVVQFAVSVVFIIMTLTVGRQMAYIQTKDLGLDFKDVVVFTIGKDESLARRFDLMQKEFMKIPEVARTTFTSDFPGMSSGNPFLVSLEGTDKKMDMFTSMTGADTLDFLGVKMLQGSGFAGLTVEGMKRKVLINASAARALGLTEAVGRRIRCDFMQGMLGVEEPLEIAGVLKDFHVGPLHDRIQPTVFFFHEEPFCALVRIRPGNTAAAMARLKEAWGRLPTFLPFEPIWLDQYIPSHAYREDRKSGQTFLLASLVSVGLACMGIYGSVAFMIGRRRREIGIRKVMGATEPGILWMLTKEFSGPVVTAAAVAWPLGIYFSRGWLNGFAYRAAIGWTTVPLAVFIVMSVAGLAVVSQALPASRENPAVTIRHE